MPLYEVSGFAEVFVWRQVEADTPEAAIAEACELGARHWDRNDATMEINSDLLAEEVTS